MPRPFLPGDLVEFLGSRDITGTVVRADDVFVLVQIHGYIRPHWWACHWWRHVRTIGERALALAAHLEDDPPYEEGLTDE